MRRHGSTVEHGQVACPVSGELEDIETCLACHALVEVIPGRDQPTLVCRPPAPPSPLFVLHR